MAFSNVSSDGLTTRKGISAAVGLEVGFVGSLTDRRGTRAGRVAWSSVFGTDVTGSLVLTIERGGTDFFLITKGAVFFGVTPFFPDSGRAACLGAVSALVGN